MSEETDESEFVTKEDLEKRILVAREKKIMQEIAIREQSLAKERAAADLAGKQSRVAISDIEKQIRAGRFVDTDIVTATLISATTRLIQHLRSLTAPTAEDIYIARPETAKDIAAIISKKLESALGLYVQEVGLDDRTEIQ